MVDEASCAKKLKVLSDDTRLAVMELLMKKPSHVGPLDDALGVEQSLLSHHLKILREAGLVVADRDGKAVLYSVAPAARTGSPETINLGCCQLVLDPNRRTPR